MPNGVDVKKFKPKREKDKNLLKKCGFTEDDIIVGFVGILRPWHGLELLLEALNLVAKAKENIRLLIVGDGPIRPDVEKKIKGLNLSGRVFITGRIPHIRIADYVNLFDIAVSPKTTFYASPMKILEYMALGKAIVAPNTENIRDILDDNVTGLLFQNNDFLELSSYLLKLASDRNYREKLGNQARHEVASKRTWKDNAMKIIKIVEADFREKSS